MFICFTICFCGCKNINQNISSTDYTSISSQHSYDGLSTAELCYHSSDGDYEYRIENNAVYITKFIGKSESVIIPDLINQLPVKSIEADAFYQQEEIQSIFLPHTLEAIGDGAFYRCYALEEIYIPQTVAAIGDNPFFRCNALHTIVVDENNPYFASVDGVLYSKDFSILYVYPENKTETDFVIPESVKQVADSAFGYWPAHLQVLEIPGTVEKMPNQGLFAYSNTGLKLLVKSGSTAEQYAQKWGMQYKVV